MKRWLILGVVLAAAAALAVVVGAGAQTKAEPLKLFVISPIATPIQNYPDPVAGAQAAAAALNKAGGIGKRQVVIDSCNTQSNANAATACARQAVSSGAVAVVGHISTLSTLEIPILQAGNVADVGFRSSGNPIDWTNPDVFPFIGGPASNYEAIPFAMKKLGKKRFVIVFQDVPSAATNAKNAKYAAKAAHLNVVGTMVLPGATTDFAPYAQKLREFNPDSVMFINSPGVSGGLMRAATALGVKPLWAHNSGSIGEPEAAQIGAPAEGMLLASDFPNFRDTGFAGIKKFVADMHSAGKDSDAINLKVTGIDGWLSVYAVAAVAKNIKGTITNTSLLAALRKQTKPIDLFGLASWAPGKKGPAAYPRWNSIKVFFETIKDGKMVAWGKPLDKPIDVLTAQHFVR